MGAQMILSPCAWAVPSGYDHAREPYGALWKDAYGDLARWFEMPVIGVSNVGVVGGGPWEGWKCIGCSLAVGPEGEVLAQAPYGESAECLLKVRAPILPRRAAGTAIAQMLRRKAGNGDWLPETVG
jgi:predicted amidohydrolase